MAIRHNINIIQGATLAYECQLVNEDDSPIDISNAVFSGQIRARIDNEILAVFNFDKTDVANGFFIVSIQSDKTAGIIRDGYYDWFAMWPGSVVDCLATGDAVRTGSATQIATDSIIDVEGTFKKLKIRLISAQSLQENQTEAVLYAQRQNLGEETTSAAWDMAQGPHGFVLTLAGNASIANPTNKLTIPDDGFLSGLIDLHQNATGGFIPTWGADFTGVANIVIDTTASVITRLASRLYDDGSIEVYNV